MTTLNRLILLSLALFIIAQTPSVAQSMDSPGPAGEDEPSERITPSDMTSGPVDAFDGTAGSPLNARRVTTPYHKVCVYWQPPTPGKRNPGDCNEEFLPPPPSTTPVVPVPPNESFFVEYYWLNDGGPSGEPTVQAQNPQLGIVFDNPVLEIRSVQLEQNGQYLDCQTVSEPHGVQCGGSSIPDGEVAIVIVELSLQSVSPVQVNATSMATAQNSINDFFNTIELIFEPIVPPGAIKVVKFIDNDGDGELDPTEPFMPDWEMTVDGEMKMTDSSGEALFQDLEPGMYTVTEEQREGWANRDDEYSQNVEVQSDETTTVYFGNFRPGDIFITKFEDKNGDGDQDEGEQPLEGWEFTLEGEGGSMQTTDVAGVAVFEDVKPGTKTITEEDREGWEPSSGNLSTTLDLIHGQSLELTIGNYRPGKITVIKFEDINGNGEQDDGEPQLDGWEITVDGDSKDTDTEGMAMFDGLEPGEYEVSEMVMDGWKNSTGNNPTTVLIESGDMKTVKFGNYEPGKITIVKYSDENRNGAKDPADTPVSGWDITCNGPSCDAVTKQTDGSGMVMFSDLDPGDYTITEGTRTGWTPVSPAGGVHMISLTSGRQITEEFLNEPPPDQPDPGSIHAQKFLDADGDGVFDPEEVGLNGVTIQLDGGAQTQITHSMDLNGDGDIDPNTERGWVWFENLPAGNYTLSEVVPTGMDITTPIGNLFNIALGEGEVNNGNKFGNIPAGEGIDLGDAPEEEEDPPRPEFPVGYPTTLANNGAAHIIDAEVRLGELIDAESDGQPTIPADGDDVDGTDDEDGAEPVDGFVILSRMLDPGSDEARPVPGQVQGRTARIAVFPSVNGVLDGWVDWNRDGDWDDDGERVYDGESVSAPADTLDWPVPADASVGYTYARLRFTLDGADTYHGVEFVGEVEDYLLYTLSPQELDSTGDEGDANPGDGICATAGGLCTLRAAIMEANASGVPYYLFAASPSKSSQTTLQPQSAYPDITGSVFIDGGSALEIDGSQAGAGANGLVFASSGSSIQSTLIHSFDGDGLRILGDANIVIDNTVSDNGGAGVNVVSGTGNVILSNSIVDNGGLGIDLGDDGHTPNDAGDADDGANRLRNSPVLTLATAENGHLEGEISSLPDMELELEFFASAACDPSGAGEGDRFVGLVTVETDGTGEATFSADLTAGDFAVGEAITATATDPDGNTSEFSECFTAVSTAIERTETDELPGAYRLAQNYPNPFNPVTTIRFAVPQSDFVRIDVYNLLGKHVARVVNRRVDAGEYSLQFDASALPSGTYIYRMTAGSYTESRQFTLLK